VIADETGHAGGGQGLIATEIDVELIDLISDRHVNRLLRLLIHVCYSLLRRIINSS